MRPFAIAVLLASVFNVSLAVAGPVEDCDRMAADPTVALEAIAVEAEGICASAVDIDDASPRLMHEYARALERVGKLQAALRYYGWAAEDGYPAAHLALLRLGQTQHTSGVGSANTDAVATYAASAGTTASELAAAISRDFTLLPSGAALRIPASVLATRRGSEPDLARLLAAVIAAQQVGAQTRYGLCTPSRDLAVTRAKVVADRPGVRAPSFLALLDKVSARPDLSAAELDVLRRLSSTWRAAVEEGRTEAAALAQDLRTAGRPVRGQNLDDLAEALSTQVFVVVEVQEGTDWRAYDPVTGGLFGPEACSSYTTAADMPSGLVPQMHVILTATEAAADETPAERVVLDATLPLDQTAVLAFAESWGLTPPDTQRKLGVQTYTPVLVAGGQAYYGSGLSLPTAPSMPPEIAAILGDQLNKAANALGSGTDASTTPGPAMPDRLRRLVLDIQLTGGDAPLEPQHFVLIDRAGLSPPLADFGGQYLDFMQLVSLLPLDGSVDVAEALPADIGLDISSAGLAAEARSAGAAMNGFEPLRLAIFADLSDAVPPLPQGVGLLMTFWKITAPATADADPGLQLRQQMLRPAEPAGPGVADPAGVAAAWAVASVLAERLSLVLSAPTAALADPGGDALGIWTAARKGGQARLVQSAADLTALSPDARARAAAHLATGRFLLSPVADLSAANEARLAWWLVSPDGLHVEDEFADGGRSELAEEAELEKEIACKNVRTYYGLGTVVSRLASLLAIVVVMSGDISDGGKAIADYAKAVAKAEEDVEKAKRATELANKACGGASGGSP